MANRLSRALEGIHNVREEVGRVMRADSWINAITGLGGTRDRTMGASIAALSIHQPVELEALYHGNDLAAKIVDRIVQDALRQGFSIEGADEQTAEALRSWGASRLLMEGGTWGRLYGAGAILIGTDESTGSMDTPLDIDTIRSGSLKYLMVLDRQNLSIVDYHEDPSDPDYGQPRTFRISHDSPTGASLLGEPVHASRLIMFGGALTAERVKIRRNGGFDLSVLQRPSEILRDVDQSWRSIMNLIQDLSQAVFAIDGLIDMIAEGEKDTMLQRMEIVDMARSVARAVVIDAESERFEHKGAANVTGIGPLLGTVFQRLAASADMPLTLLMGTSPGGLNATGESDTRGWYDHVQSYRDKELAPALQTLARVIEADAGRPMKDEPMVEWPPLWQPTLTEQAALDKAEAETDKVRIDSQVLFPEEVTLAKFQDDAIYADVIDFKLREESLKELDEVEPIEVDPELDEEPEEENVPEPDDKPEPATSDEAVDPATALNGAQFKQMQETVLIAASGALPKRTVIRMIAASFPMSEEDVAYMLEDVDPRTFEPEPEPEPEPISG